jgi:hypothetical protein
MGLFGYSQSRKAGVAREEAVAFGEGGRGVVEMSVYLVLVRRRLVVLRLILRKTSFAI